MIRVGEYTITLTAVNSVSQSELTKKIFVLRETCEPPVLKLFGPRRKANHEVDEVGNYSYRILIKVNTSQKTQ